jgi:hypothetical protein
MTEHKIEVIEVPKSHTFNDGRVKTWIEYLPLCSECGVIRPPRGNYYTKTGARNAGVRHVTAKTQQYVPRVSDVDTKEDLL